MTLREEARAWIAQDPALARLTDRQQEVARRLADGETAEQIAAALGIARATVGNHVIGIRGRMDTRRRERPPQH